jgi:hypothetical protein
MNMSNTNKGMSLDEFLGHETNAGGRSGFLRGWRKRKPPAVNTWLHTRAPIIAIWQHGWPRIHTFEDRDTKQTRREVWGGTWNCLESEQVLRKQNKRDDDGARSVPPQACPLCLLIEHLREQVLSGEMKITQPVFEFKIDGDDEHARILTAGGITGLYDNDHLTDVQRADIRKAGVRLTDAWQEAARAKCNYLFRVVDDDHPEGGVQIATETTLLGDKVKQVIRDQMTAMGDVDGNPLKKPYAIRWEHRPAEQEFSKKYHALVMPKLAVREEIRRLIYDEDPPDVSALVAPGNVKALRAAMEQYAVTELPFDDIFAAGEERVGVQHEPKPVPVASKASPPHVVSPPSTRAEVAASDNAVIKSAVAKSRRTVVEEPLAPAPVEDDGHEPCVKCGAMMGPEETVCAACGARYVIDEPAPKPAAKAKPKAAPKAKPSASAGATDDDDIPFAPVGDVG